ncbi:hypothetical protein PSTT_14814 [Puccinia striiformis]|uniref:Uncharacterized protein n=1 Tax=Puccinia striiformis TaxID=27350 RepID=A0A2S4UKJ3_9BASI|nr:hypothetical protein PSTT_14814 [Puccinia striiformis]
MQSSLLVSVLIVCSGVIALPTPNQAQVETRAEKTRPSGSYASSEPYTESDKYASSSSSKSAPGVIPVGFPSIPFPQGRLSSFLPTTFCVFLTGFASLDSLWFVFSIWSLRKRRPRFWIPRIWWRIWWTDEREGSGKLDAGLGGKVAAGGSGGLNAAGSVGGQVAGGAQAGIGAAGSVGGQVAGGAQAGIGAAGSVGGQVAGGAQAGIGAAGSVGGQVAGGVQAGIGAAGSVGGQVAGGAQAGIGAAGSVGGQVAGGAQAGIGAAGSVGGQAAGGVQAGIGAAGSVGGQVAGGAQAGIGAAGSVEVRSRVARQEPLMPVPKPLVQ